MHEPEPPAWAREWIRKKGERRIAMTPEEKKRSAECLSRLIFDFFDSLPVSTNQEAIEILGIATMYYHSFVYAVGLSKIEEKP